MKICSNKNCLFATQPQSLNNFSKDRRTVLGLQPKCKLCNKQYRKTHQKQIVEYQERYRKISKLATKEKAKQYYAENKERILIQHKQYHKQKRKEDINFRIIENIRSRLNQAIKNDQKSGSAVADLMMSISDFKIYLEERFYLNPETGEMMTWNNYGMFGWHIDHIIPLSSFDLTNRLEFLKAVHYSNLRPMWAKQNISDGDRGMSKRKNLSLPNLVINSVGAKTS